MPEPRTFEKAIPPLIPNYRKHTSNPNPSIKNRPQKRKDVIIDFRDKGKAPHFLVKCEIAMLEELL